MNFRRCISGLKRWEFPGSDLLVYQRVEVPKLGFFKIPYQVNQMLSPKIGGHDSTSPLSSGHVNYSPCQKIQRGHTCRITSYTVGISQLGEAPILGGGCLNIILFSPVPGEMMQFDEHIFSSGWFNHQPEGIQSHPSGYLNIATGFLGILSVEDLRLGGYLWWILQSWGNHQLK